MQYPYHLNVNVEIIIIQKKLFIVFWTERPKKYSLCKKKKREKNVAKITALTQSNGSSFSYNSAVQLWFSGQLNNTLFHDNSILTFWNL